MRHFFRMSLVAALLALCAAPAASSYAVDHPARRGPASVRLEGRGYGHGHGMSQYGAQGAARKGLGYRRIISFYYPHTAWARTGGSVSVHITEDTSQDVVVGARKGLTLRALKGRTWHLHKAGARRWRILPAAHGARSRLQVLVHRWRLVRTVNGPAEFAAGGAAMRLYFRGGSRTYHGALRSAGGAHRVTVNVVGLDTYLKGVVPSEMPASWKPAAVQAQAVAARTYAAYERAHPLSRHYQICDTASCQVYGGASAEYAASNRAVGATAHRIRTAGGMPAFTQFSASNGGWTSYGGFPYLPAKKDPYDRWSGNPYRDWHVTVRATTIEHAFPGIGDFRRLRILSRNGHGAWGGRVTRIRIVGGSGSHTMSGDAFRSVFGLRSDWFRPA